MVVTGYIRMYYRRAFPPEECFRWIGAMCIGPCLWCTCKISRNTDFEWCCWRVTEKCYAVSVEGDRWDSQMLGVILYVKNKLAVLLQCDKLWGTMMDIKVCYDEDVDSGGWSAYILLKLVSPANYTGVVHSILNPINCSFHTTNMAKVPGKFWQ